jgi:hypothetical protein
MRSFLPTTLLFVVFQGGMYWWFHKRRSGWSSSGNPNPQVGCVGRLIRSTVLRLHRIPSVDVQVQCILMSSKPSKTKLVKNATCTLTQYHPVTTFHLYMRCRTSIFHLSQHFKGKVIGHALPRGKNLLPSITHCNNLVLPLNLCSSF